VATVVWDPQQWAKRQFGDCELGNAQRTQRLIKVAVQLANRPDVSLPNQTEEWGDCKAAYRLFNQDEVTFQKIIAPHCRQTREACRPGEVKLILNDTTEIDYTGHRKTTGLGPIGNGRGRGFFLHTAMMVDDGPQHAIEGLAAQDIFYRKASTGKQKSRSKDSQRSTADRESAVWGRVFDAVGRPPEGVVWKHICDRGADDVEVLWRARHNGCGFVIRGSRMQRKVLSPDGRELPLVDYLAELPVQGETRVVTAQSKKKGVTRQATVSLRFGEVLIPLSRTLTPWLKAHRPTEPLRVGIVELRELSPPDGEKAVRWVLFVDTPVTSIEQADQEIVRYEQRWAIEEYHKALKTGCGVERRQLRTADRLERLLGVSAVVAVRLVQLKTAARETPERPARELVPARWIKILQIDGKRPMNPDLSIHAFLRMLAQKGGFLARKRDGEPGWLTIWRGFDKLILLVRGADAERGNDG